MTHNTKKQECYPHYPQNYPHNNRFFAVRVEKYMKTGDIMFTMPRGRNVSRETFLPLLIKRSCTQKAARKQIKRKGKLKTISNQNNDAEDNDIGLAGENVSRETAYHARRSQWHTTKSKFHTRIKKWFII